MVYLVQKSKLNPQTQPQAYKWDTLARKHHNRYQDLIDAHTYQLQRTQRYLLSTKYPKSYYSHILKLNLLKNKQIIGQVTQQQTNLYKNIDPNISINFNRVFNGSFLWPKLGIAIGVGLFGYGTAIKTTMGARLFLLAAPIFVDYLRLSNDIQAEHKVQQFMNWVISYRRAKTFNQKHKNAFNSQKTKKLIGQNGLVQMGKQMLNLCNS